MNMPIDASPCPRSHAVIWVVAFMLLISCQPSLKLVRGVPYWKTYIEHVANAAHLPRLGDSAQLDDKACYLWSVATGETEAALGYALRRNAGHSQGMFIKVGRRGRIEQTEDVTPKMGWDAFWNALEERGVFTMPDESPIAGAEGPIHGVWICAETYDKGRVHRWHYNNPWLGHDDRRQQVREIVALLGRQLGDVRMFSLKNARQ